jgi:hypothetical protein
MADGQDVGILAKHPAPHRTARAKTGVPRLRTLVA